MAIAISGSGGRPVGGWCTPLPASAAAPPALEARGVSASACSEVGSRHAPVCLVSAEPNGLRQLGPLGGGPPPPSPRPFPCLRVGRSCAPTARAPSSSSLANSGSSGPAAFPRRALLLGARASAVQPP